MARKRHRHATRHKPAWMIEPSAGETHDENKETAEREPSRMSRFAKYGFIAGIAVAMYYIESNSPASLGFYAGPVPLPLVFVFFAGGGALAGAGFAWWAKRSFPDDSSKP